MRRSPLAIHFAAVATTADAIAMSSRPPYRSGCRGFCNRPYDEQGGNQLVTGDSHIRSVQDANRRFRGVGRGGRPVGFPNHNEKPRPSPRFNYGPQYRQSQRPFDRRQPFHQLHRPSLHHNQPIRPPPQPRPRFSKPLDYREWEYAKIGPPPASERFVVLSYNILADYLAIDHRRKLYFHIPEYMLSWQWRKKSIVFELGLWSADIMCLQEVDRFQDLERELKLRGYCGVWKMRTGSATDGCAVFWREARFKLVHEESLEFSKLSLRDNVAQICVLKLFRLNDADDTAPAARSSAGSNHVVICNIHVLYNPKRGEIKLGQVRTLLERASAVSKVWDNAPVVLCGDFNCTPKSPLYKFIMEQKLDLSGVDRDKVSGQASAQIRSSRPHCPNAGNHWAGISENFPGSADSGQVDMKLNDPPSIGGRGNDVKSSSSLTDAQDGNQSDSSDKIFISYDAFETMASDSKTAPFVSNEDPGRGWNSLSGEAELGDEGKDSASSDSNQVSPGEQSASKDNAERKGKQFSTSSASPALGNSASSKEFCKVKLSKVVENSPLESSGNFTIRSAVQGENCSLSTRDEMTVWNFSADVNNVLEKKLDEVSLSEPGGSSMEREGTSEHDGSFLSALHNNGFDHSVRSDQDLSSTSGEYPNDSLDMDSQAVIMEKSAYDPALWTPMEIAIATGNPDSTLVEHQLSLKSTYTEVEDRSNTRDSHGEPLVTSYNRCFKGTVDYIWRSEGLQTVGVLAPMPSEAMEWTRGFPTKKWGSDHIALASELAFSYD